MQTSKIPITVISGFLGVGKTTLVNHLLSQNKQYRIGVVVNEFGEVGIDGQLIVAAQEALIEINNGCVCCTVRADLVASVKEMLNLAGNRLDRLIVETSGLADPAPVLQTFLADLDLRSQVVLESVVTLIDAVHLAAQLDDEIVNHSLVPCLRCKEMSALRFNRSRSICSKTSTSTTPLSHWQNAPI